MERRSIRKYGPGVVPDADLKTILDAARQAPTAGNRQRFHLVVVRDPAIKQQLAEAARKQYWFADASVVVVGAAFPADTGIWPIVDTTIAMQNMVLAANALGYGTCWVGAHADDAIRKIVGLPEDAVVVALTPIGQPAESPAAKPRKPQDEVLSDNRFGEKLDLW
jgi:nitroreductase